MFVFVFSVSPSAVVSVENVSKSKMSRQLQKDTHKKKADEELISVQKRCLKHSRVLRRLVQGYITADRRGMEELDDGSAEYIEWAAAFHKVSDWHIWPYVCTGYVPIWDSLFESWLMYRHTVIYHFSCHHVEYAIV